MILSKPIQDHLESALSDHFNSTIKISSANPVGGGSINSAFHLQTNKADLFLKQNETNRFPGMFEAEQNGMQLLRSNFALHIPETHFTTESGDHQFIVMEWIQRGARGKNFFHEFGKKLSEMHRMTDNHFGLDHDNYIGRLPQSNSQTKDWLTFFVTQRLEKQVHEAVDNKAIEITTARSFQKLYMKLESIVPEERPALLHGDLWSGNFMPDAKGAPCIFDPAVYYGHREMDIAMTQLFGGFGDEFYDSYNEHFPMEKGWQERMDICNLYPLMVHVNLFGGGYVNDVKGILQRFT